MDNQLSKLVSGGLRSVAASFPVAASFAQAWSELETRRFQERVEEFMREFRRLVQLNQDKVQAVEKQIQESGEFAELLDRAIRKVIVESDKEKRRAYAITLFNCVTDPAGADIGRKVDALEALDSLNRVDLDILRKFAVAHPIRVATLLPLEYIDPTASEEKLAQRIDPIIQSLAKLESRALISETVAGAGVFSWTGDANHWANRWRAKTFTILPFGRTLLRYLEEKA